MSIYSDYKVGALSDEEFREECKRINREDRIDREEYWKSFENDEEDDDEYES